MLRLKKPYYYVPPCPECGSRKTGRYYRRPFTPGDERYTMEHSLMNGELIRFVPWPPEKNAYCEECGHEWAQDVRVSWVLPERITEEIRARGTDDAYAKYNAENPKKKKTILGKICGFLP